ncbi:FAD-dependent oxidoreductase [Mycobacteroides sp. LB1]|uniref:NAD(P)/FAD-dependent oxidoreductase n=1 Tax=Mycobacteroides sp. LB1 TaxID=2750814 RepID=UPI0015DEFE44|nr:FAD-dependent oxidoreductase [Mycobacteroides sp. LB1]
MTETYVVIGASLAGARAVETLRADGFDGRILLIGAEHRLPYDRPPLSKEVLTGQKQPDETRIHPAKFYSDNGIELLLGTRATRIDAHGQRVELAGGQSVAADKVLICTGGTPRRPEIDGIDLDGIYFLRTVDDAVSIRERIGNHSSVVILGGGLIGMELAASVRARGAAVTVLERDAGVLRRVLADDIGDRLARMHVGSGVEIRMNARIARIEGDGNHVRRIRMADGSVIEADLVLVGIGAAPAVDIAEASGIETDNGIVVNEFCATSIPNVYAAGDVTNHPNRTAGGRVRLEHWQNAQNQGIAAAHSMTGRGSPYRDVPWFWSDQGDTNIQVAGCPHRADRVVRRGDPDSLEFSAFHLKDGILVGAVGINKRRDVRMAMDLIDTQARPDPVMLADPAVDLRQVSAGSSTAGGVRV